MATPSLLPRRLLTLPIRSRIATPSPALRRFIDTDAKGTPSGAPPKATTTTPEPAPEQQQQTAAAPKPQQPTPTQPLTTLSSTLLSRRSPRPRSTESNSATTPFHLFGSSSPTTSSSSSSQSAKEPYRLHIYSHKHNTHITLAKPNKDCVISLSTGNIGFKKSKRGTYDAAYQLAAHVFTKLEEKRERPRNLEVVLRGFGAGREAVVKALLGSEGRFLKPAIRRVSDATRLKFGGTRSKAPRRLG